MVGRKSMGRISPALLVLLSLGCAFATYNLITMVRRYQAGGGERELAEFESVARFADPVVRMPDNSKKVMVFKRRFHVALTATDASYSKWQCRIMYYWYKKTKELEGSEMGGFTRVLHSGKPDDLMDEIPTFVVDPLPSGLDLAEFTPDDLYNRKRPIELMDSSEIPASILPAEKCRKLSSNGTKVETENENISDSDLDNIVGTADCSEEITPPDTMQCELRPYQKQALYWMMQMERGKCLEKAATTLHPCWSAYRLADRRESIVYLNAFSGDVTTEFPSTLQFARGILADAMGLGKTIMTIALMLAHSDKSVSSTLPASQIFDEMSQTGHCPDQSPKSLKKLASASSFNKLVKPKTTVVGGGNLIVCPMMLLGQWKAEVETHAQPGSLTVYVHYGQSRAKDAKFLAQCDVVLTTYGVLASEFSTENAEDNGGLYSVRWF